MNSNYDGPYMDDMGDFFAIIGEHRKLEFLRQWMSFTAMDLFDICDGRTVWDDIRIAKARIVDIDDQSTWDDETRDAVADDGWYYEWDVFMVLDKDGPFTVTVYAA
jgi:hypothetical protein